MFPAEGEGCVKTWGRTGRIGVQGGGKEAEHVARERGGREVKRTPSCPRDSVALSRGQVNVLRGVEQTRQWEKRSL